MKMHISLKVLMLSLFVSCTIQSNDTYILGLHRNAQKAGFFSSFIAVLNKLVWCIEMQRTPVVYWDDSFAFYEPQGYNGSIDNCWEYYFEPISSGIYKIGDPIDVDFTGPNGFFIFSWNAINIVSKFQRHWVKTTLIDPFIKIKSQVQEKIDDFYHTHMFGKKTVGVHLRGTDKYTEVPQVAPDTIFAEANQYNDCQFLVATDEQALLELAKLKLNGPVIYYDCYRSKDHRSIHETETAEPYNRAKLGEDVLIECLLLSKCDKFIHTNSNVSVAALYFNPELDNTLLTA